MISYSACTKRMLSQPSERNLALDQLMINLRMDGHQQGWVIKGWVSMSAMGADRNDLLPGALVDRHITPQLSVTFTCTCLVGLKDL